MGKRKGESMMSLKTIIILAFLFQFTYPQMIAASFLDYSKEQIGQYEL